MDPEQLAEIALQAGRKAAEVHQRYAGRLAVEDWAEKGAADFVTHVDREAEAEIVEHVLERCPGHRIMAEESTDLGDADSVRARFDEAEYLWVIDPLDGTTNFLHDYPAYAASVAVAHRGELVAGAVVDGRTGTAWWAWKGGGAWRDDQPIRVSDIERLEHSLIGTGFPFKVLDRLGVYLGQLGGVLRKTSGVRRGGAAALDLCHVADGRFEGFWELWLAPWDIAAGTLIIREAGGVVSSLDGDPDVRAAGAVVAGSPTIHAKLLGLLGGHEVSANPIPRMV